MRKKGLPPTVAAEAPSKCHSPPLWKPTTKNFTLHPLNNVTTLQGTLKQALCRPLKKREDRLPAENFSWNEGSLLTTGMWEEEASRHCGPLRSQ